MEKDRWDKSKIIAEILALLIIASFGYCINANLKQKELNVQMIKVAVDILATKPTQETDPLRNWAIDILEKYSEVKLTATVKDELKKRSIKEINYLLAEDGNIITDEAGNPIETE